MRPWHLRFSSEGRLPLFPAEAERRAAVRRLVRLAGDCLIGFSIADDHAHVAPYCDRRRAGVLKRTIRVGLQTDASVQIEEAHLKSVQTRRHLIWLVDYLLQQVDHHDLEAHPATWSGSNFQDLIGARVVAGLDLRVRDALPRFQVGSAWSAVGLPVLCLEPATDREIRELGAFRLVAAAAEAVCADPSLAGRGEEVVMARNAACRIGLWCGLPSSELAAALGVQERSVRRAAARGADPRVLRAVRLAIALQRVVARHGRLARVG